MVYGLMTLILALIDCQNLKFWVFILLFHLGYLGCLSVRTKIVHDPRKDSHLELAHFYLNVCIFPDTHNFDLILKSSLKKVVYLLCCIQIHADLEVLGNDSFCCIQIHADLAVRCRAIDLIHPKEAL